MSWNNAAARAWRWMKSPLKGSFRFGYQLTSQRIFLRSMQGVNLNNITNLLSCMAKEGKKFTNISTTGFGNRADQSGRRFYRKDGSVNVVHRGIGLLDRLSWFHAMIAMPRWKFYSTLCGVYIGINLIFAVVYYFIGVEYLSGIQSET